MLKLDIMFAEPFHFVLDQWMARSSLCLAVMQTFSVRQDNSAENIRTADLDDIQNSREGDPDAYRRLIERHQPAIGKLMWRFTRDRTEHEELVQQAFVEAYLSLAGFGGKAPFAHWLARIATRVGYRYWSRTRHCKTVSLQDREWELLSQPTSKGIDSEQAAELVHRLLGQLPPRDRLVLTLRYLEQCDVAQAAYRIGWSEMRVRVQTHRAIAKLKKLSVNIQIELDL